MAITVTTTDIITAITTDIIATTARAFLVKKNRLQNR
jgi:hypothetical protein